MDEAVIKQALEFMEKLFLDPTCEVSIERGTMRIDKGDAYWHFGPAEGQYTVTIKTRGGAQEVERHEYMERLR
jgi:hypothetical protein